MRESSPDAFRDKNTDVAKLSQLALGSGPEVAPPAGDSELRAALGIGGNSSAIVVDGTALASGTARGRSRSAGGVRLAPRAPILCR